MYRLTLEIADALTFTPPHPMRTLYLCASRIAWRLLVLGGLAVRCSAGRLVAVPSQHLITRLTGSIHVSVLPSLLDPGQWSPTP